MRRRVHPPALAGLALILATCSCTTPGTHNGSLPSPKAVLPSASPSPAPRVPSPATATPSSPGGRETGAAGSAGYGDPRYARSGNGGYDAESYVLDLSYDPDSNTLRSAAHLRATITSPEPLNRFNLDLQPTMKVSAVTVNGTAASFVHKEAELVIRPAALLEPKSTLVVDVRYSGKPAVVRSGRRGPPEGGWYRTKSGGAFVAGEPISASAWYPVNEHPGDTATFAITATVADGWKVISNGIPLTTDLPDPGEGRSLFRWQLNQPIASYLTTIYIDKFTTVEERLSNGTPIVSAIGPDVEGARELATQTDTVIDVLASYLGPYPFGAAGGIFPGESSTHIDLETATRPIYSGGSVDNVDIVVHELAHQWFGNSVTLKRWSDICINECFASYAVWLFHEKVDGQTSTPAGNARCAAQSPILNSGDHRWWRCHPARSSPPSTIVDRSLFRRCGTRWGMTNSSPWSGCGQPPMVGDTHRSVSLRRSRPGSPAVILRRSSTLGSAGRRGRPRICATPAICGGKVISPTCRTAEDSTAVPRQDSAGDQYPLARQVLPAVQHSWTRIAARRQPRRFGASGPAPAMLWSPPRRQA